MSAIKVGSKVRSKVTCRIDSQATLYYKGDVGIVVEQGESTNEWFVNWLDQGNKSVYGDGRWWVGFDDVELVADRVVAGHSGRHDGLQQHSVGGCYPYAVVTYGHDPAIHVVENLANGTVACFSTGVPRQWTNATMAFDFCNRMADGYTGDGAQLGPIVWFAGRPKYDPVRSCLYLPQDHKPTQAILLKFRLRLAESIEAARIGRPLTAYELYQLAHDVDNR